MSEESIQGNEAGSGENRWKRALALYRDGYFERLSADEFLIVNPTSRAEYTVNLKIRYCKCEDFKRHQHHEGFVCKHLIAARLYRGWLRKSATLLAPIFGGVE